MAENESLECDAIGFAENLRVRGRKLTFRGVTVVGVVRQDDPPQALEAGQIVFDSRDISHIELLQSAIVAEPKNGEIFRDATGKYHRVEVLHVKDFTYLCDCIVTSAP